MGRIGKYLWNQTNGTSCFELVHWLQGNWRWLGRWLSIVVNRILEIKRHRRQMCKDGCLHQRWHQQVCNALGAIRIDIDYLIFESVLVCQERGSCFQWIINHMEFEDGNYRSGTTNDQYAHKSGFTPSNMLNACKLYRWKNILWCKECNNQEIKVHVWLFWSAPVADILW